MNKKTQLRWLLWRLSMAADAMEAAADPKFVEIPGLPQSIANCAKVVRYLIDRATDPTLCNNDCKGMYYCELKKHHEGQHKEGGLAWD